MPSELSKVQPNHVHLWALLVQLTVGEEGFFGPSSPQVTSNPVQGQTWPQETGAPLCHWRCRHTCLRSVAGRLHHAAGGHEMTSQLEMVAANVQTVPKDAMLNPFFVHIAGQDFTTNHASPDVDFAAIHMWPDRWTEVRRCARLKSKQNFKV